MKINLQGKKALILDHGLYVSTATRLAREDAFGPGNVGYHCPWKRGFPSFHEKDIGRGLEGIKLEPDFWKAVDSYDLLIFPDVLDGDLQVWLRKRGYRVYGSGLGEELELFRYYQKRMLDAVGLPVNPYVVVKGLPALRDYLKVHDNRVIKLSLLRGITETFKHKTYWQSEMRLDRLEHELGIRKRFQEFVVEEMIETDLEYGYDGPCVHGEFPNVAANGVESKDAAYACVVQDYDDLPEGMRLVNERLAPALKAYGYANFFSTEIRDNGKPYLIDITARKPSPAGETQEELWTNLAEMMWLGAEGKSVDPEPVAKYAVQSIITSDFAEEDCLAIYVPPQYRNNVKLYHHCREGGHDYVIAQATKAVQMAECGSIVTIGNDLDETIAENKKIAALVHGDKVEVKTKQIGDVVDEFDEMRRRGMSLKPAEI